MTADPRPGDAAPDFALPGDGGATVSLAALRGGNVVIYFYPKDDTSGCTREAIDFTARADAFKAANTTVVGISADSVTKHDKFKRKHGLSVVLASDEQHQALAAYGVWVEKSMYGRKYMGIERATFLVDAQGVISKVWRKVKVPGHAEDVLVAARQVPG
jgi:peroxiredoxin Q/BCP